MTNRIQDAGYGSRIKINSTRFARLARHARQARQAARRARQVFRICYAYGGCTIKN